MCVAYSYRMWMTKRRKLSAGTLEEPSRRQQVVAEKQPVLGTRPDRLDAVAAAHGGGQNQSDERFERR